MNVPFKSPKFSSLRWTAKGEARASVKLRALETLWFNTGTLCNIACTNCYIESSPRNDRLAYLSLAEVRTYLDEIERDAHPTRLIGFTGGEPFMNQTFPAMLQEALSRGFETLTLTNAMRPMMRRKEVIARLASTYGPAMRVRVSLDDHRPEIHDRERGEGSFARAMQGLRWLVSQNVTVEVAGRYFSGDTEDQLREGFARMLHAHGVEIDTSDPRQLVLFPKWPPTLTPRKSHRRAGGFSMSHRTPSCARTPAWL